MTNGRFWRCNICVVFSSCIFIEMCCWCVINHICKNFSGTIEYSFLPPHHGSPRILLVIERYQGRQDRLHPMDSFQGTKKSRVKPLQYRCKRDVIWSGVMTNLLTYMGVFDLAFVSTYRQNCWIKPNIWHLGRKRGVWASIIVGFNYGS